MATHGSEVMVLIWSLKSSVLAPFAAMPLVTNYSKSN